MTRTQSTKQRYQRQKRALYARWIGHDKITFKKQRRLMTRFRQTEYEAAILAVYGPEDVAPPVDAAIEELIDEGTWQRCTRCKKAMPADVEHFRKDARRLRGFTQPCLKCHRILTRLAMDHGRNAGLWRRKVHKRDS